MAILFVPGFMTDQTLWDDCIQAFEHQGPIHHVDTTLDSSVEGIAARALRDAAPSFLLVGFSFGGYVAREIVRCAPERVEGLVLVATSARRIESRGEAVSQVTRTGFAGLSRRSIEAALDPDHADTRTVERIRSMSARLGPNVFLRQSGMRRDGDADRLAAIGCPTLVVAASGDRLRSIDESRELCEGIPDAELSLIEGSGHMIPIEAPRKFAATVGEWLERRGLGRSSGRVPGVAAPKPS